MLFTSLNAYASGITWPRGHVALHFNCLNLRNEIVPLMMLLVSCGTDASANDIIWLKCHVASHFDYLDLINTVVQFTMPMASGDAITAASGITLLKSPVLPHFVHPDLIMQWWHLQCHWYHVIAKLVPMTSKTEEKSCCTSFWLSWQSSCSSAIDDAICIIWCWCWCP